MKKIVMVITGLLIVGLTQVNAQSSIFDKLSFGVKAEGNASNFILSDLDNTKMKIGVGGSVGGFIKFDISKNFAIQEDILFSYLTSEWEQEGVKDTYQSLAVEVPIYAMGQWSLPSGGRIYAGIGPYFAMSVKAKLKDSDLDLYKKIDGETPFTRMTAGGAALIGYEFNFGLQVNASYRLGLINSLDSKKDDAKMNSQVVSFGIGYRF